MRGLVDGALVTRAGGKYAALAVDHDVARVVRGRSNQVDVLLASTDPVPNRLDSRSGLAEASSCLDEPRGPVTGGYRLLWSPPQFPAVQSLLRLLRRQTLDQAAELLLR